MRRKTLQQQLREIDFYRAKSDCNFSPFCFHFQLRISQVMLPHKLLELLSIYYDCSPSSSSVCHKYLSVGVSLGLRLVSLIIFIP